jgi:hypothetical protein
VWGERFTFSGWGRRHCGFFAVSQREKKLFQEAKAFQVRLGKLVEKVGKRGIAIFANKAAVDVLGDAKKSLGRTGVNGGGKVSVASHASAKRRTKRRVVDVFILLMIRHRKIPLDNDLLSAYAKKGKGVKMRFSLDKFAFFDIIK